LTEIGTRLNTLIYFFEGDVRKINTSQTKCQKTHHPQRSSVIPLILCFLIIIAILLLLFFVDYHFISKNKHIEKPKPPEYHHRIFKKTPMPTTTTTTKTTTTRKNHSNNLNSSSSNGFKWTKSCGQTYYKSNINLGRRIRKRIVGGETAPDYAWPFLASLRIKLAENKSEHHCGATLISDQYALTAAHCLLIYFKILSYRNMTSSRLYSLAEIHLGINEHNQKENQEMRNTSFDREMFDRNHVYQIEKFIVHGDFSFGLNTLMNDVALLKLNRRVNLNRPEVNLACMPNRPNLSVKEGEKVVVLGWGTYVDDFDYQDFYKDQVQQAVFSIRNENDTDCNYGEIGREWDKEGMLCAHRENDSNEKLGTCYGDSGGPVLALDDSDKQRWTLQGIISFGHDIRDTINRKKRCDATMPFYFVKVKKYVDWIKNETNLTFDG
jgi:secreted trypsin-like serine protease